MDPTEPTSESLENLARHGELGARAELMSAAQNLGRFIPQLVGLSLTKYTAEGPITLVATTPEVLPLDAVQYVADEPYLEAVQTAQPVHVPKVDPLDEEQWSLFARVASVRGVQSSLSLPQMSTDVVVGSANLYASEAGAFTGRIEAVAEVLGAWAPGAVADADLTFDSRWRAFETSRELERRDRLVKRAAEIVAELTGTTLDEAHITITESAARAGIPLAEFSRTIIVFHD